MSSGIKKYIYISLFAVLITVCSWISVPAAIPFSLQTFAVFSAVNILGEKRAAAAISVYILMGAVGLPVFTGFRGGLSALLSHTGGFIFGFFMIPLCSYLVGFFIKSKPLKLILGEIVGLLLCYLTGILWFSFTTDSFSLNSLAASFTTLVLPYLIPDILKLIFAYCFSKKLVNRL